MTTRSQRSGSSPKFASLCLLAALAAGASFLGGCVTVTPGAPGASAVAYSRGELQSSAPYNLDTTYASARQALADLQFLVIEDKKTLVDAELAARTATDKKVTIELERLTDSLTKVRIRVGLIGDEQLSMTILQKINADLK